MPDQSIKISAVALLALGTAVVGLAALLLSGLGTKLGWWGFRTGLTVFRYAAFAGLAASILGAVAAIRTRPGRDLRGFPIALLALIAGIGTVAGPIQMMRKAKQVPMIHDITTDVVNPPEFQAVLPLRSAAINPPAHQGAEVIKQQQTAYPDIVPLEMGLSPAAAHQKALEAAKALGWEVVASDPQAGRIEAVDTTPFFGFKDDVVIRITPQGTGARVDVRSKSRVGKSDVGKNAERIRTFFKAMR